MKKSALLLFIIMAFYTIAYSQEKGLNDSLLSFAGQVNAEKTSNSKDILSNVFRTSISNLLGQKKSFEFNSTLYGIDSLFKKNAVSNTPSVYSKQRWLRNIQINLSVKGDSSSNEITEFAGGFTIALIKKRDITYGDFRSIMPKFKNFERLRKKLNFKVSAENPGISFDSIQKSWTDYDVNHDYKKLHPLILKALEEFDPVDIAFIKSDSAHLAFVNIAALYARKPLLTISPGYTYNRLNKQSSLALSAAFLVGLGSSVNTKPWELEAKSSFSIGADTTIAVANYANRPFLVSAGVNKVLREDINKISTLELKGFFQYGRQFGDVPLGTDAGKLTFNTTLRVNVYKSFWLPLTLSYDIKNANVLGFLSFTANIDK
jgi:hypothetical protein